MAGKQMVEIAKALSFHSKIIIMDEPSATLTTNELQHLFEIIDVLKRRISLSYTYRTAWMRYSGCVIP